MRMLVPALVSVLLAVAAENACPQSPSDGTVSLQELITAVAKRTSRKFIVDPRVRAQVTLIGQQPGSVTYAELLEILQTHGYATVETGRYVRIVPDAVIRSSAIPLVEGRESLPGAQVVSRVIVVKSMPAAELVPILRPLMPQYGHFAALPCRNALILVDTFANVKRLEALISALDTGAPFTPPSCGHGR